MSSSSPHRLAGLLNDAARGHFSIFGGLVEVLPAPPGPAMAVVGLTGHYVVATAAPEEWVREQLPEGVLLRPLGPRFLAALGDRLGRRDDGVDMLLARPGLEGDVGPQEVSRKDHARFCSSPVRDRPSELTPNTHDCSAVPSPARTV